MPSVTTARIDTHTDALPGWLANRWLWCVVAFTALALSGIGYNTAAVGVSLGDTDDATRLIQVRALLDGAAWFDLTLPRFGVDTPLISHWSRLVDVPLALLIAAFGLLTTREAAETWARLVWPAVLLVVLLRVLSAEAEHRGGTAAAVIAIVLGVTSLSGLYQFAAGRIDHHNVMILATVGGVLAGLRALQRPELGWIAGGLLGFALVVGYEPLPLIAPLFGLLSVAAVFQQRLFHTVRPIALGLLAVLVIGTLLTVPPSMLLTPACDAIGLNLVLLLAPTTYIVTALTVRRRTPGPWLTLGLLALAGALGLVGYLASNTACLAGPLAGLPAGAKRDWFDGVIEGRSIVGQFKTFPVLAAVFVAFASAALAAALHRARVERTADAIGLCAALSLAIAAALAMMKYVPYATFLAVVVLSIAIARLNSEKRLLTRVAATFVISQPVLAAFALTAFAAVGIDDDNPDDAVAKVSDVCTATTTVRAFATVPAGLVVTDWNLGPYIVATTPHRVLAGPYHRGADAIVETHALFSGPVDTAEARLRRMGATYVAVCMPAQRAHARAAAEPGLRAALIAGQTPAFLSPVAVAFPDGSLKLWRLAPSTQ